MFLKMCDCKKKSVVVVPFKNIRIKKKHLSSVTYYHKKKNPTKHYKIVNIILRNCSLGKQFHVPPPHFRARNVIET